MTRPLCDRLLEKVSRLEDGCWLWTASTDGGGYGKIYAGKKVRSAHRVAYELFVGPIPEGLTLDHLCRVRRCVNPAHLEPVTMRENLLRGKSPSAVAARRTCCAKGHEYTPGNVYRRPLAPTERRCLKCHRAQMRKSWHARRLSLNP